MTSPATTSTEHTKVQYLTKEVTNSDLTAWNEYVKKHKASCAYHLLDFKPIVEQSFGHKALYLAAYDHQQHIVGILPLVHTKSRIFGSYMTSIPYFNYGGPLTDNPSVESQLIQHADRLSKTLGASHIEIRETNPRQNTPSKTDKMSMFLALPDSSDTLWSDIGTKARAQIKKGLKNNLVFKTGKHELLKDFYRVFSINMRDLGTPVYSISFFEHILSSKLDTTLAVQYHEGAPVSCAFLIGYKGCLEIPWASTLRSANKLDSNMVLYWNILKFACNNKYLHFDFGRSSKDAPTFKFKKQWGARPSQLHWHYLLPEGEALPNLNPNNPKLKLIIWCWTKLPLFIANALGPFLARSLP
ncbi:hypothetical protein A9Q81_11290 [Gammaproteobacteria bacterium 42_54_T18]|nr:hypothetical protein A9Q81_11290 [Gammaproteobacteria bacterium 42_54_T18]